MSYQQKNLALAVGCLFVVLISFYLQYGLQQQPCPLCLLQRFVMIIITAVVFITALFKSSLLRRGLLSVSIIFSFFGGLLAGRQLWLQHLPADQAPACGPSLNFLLENLPFHQAIATAFRGSGSCASSYHYLFGVNLAVWSLLTFSLLTLLFFYQWFQAVK